MSAAALATLRADTTLGSGNFLERCQAVASSSDLDFILLEKPFTAPNGRAYRTFSLDTLLEARRSLASWYASIGVGPRDVVAVCVSDGIGPFLHYVALSSLGAAAALINPAVPTDSAVSYILKNDFSLFVSDSAVHEQTHLTSRLEKTSLTCKLVADSPTRNAGPISLPPWWPFQHEDSTLVMLSHTSGTTGVPKAVRFEHRQFFMGKRARIGHFLESADERILSALPQSHSSAISHLETVILHGVQTLVLSHALGQTLRQNIRSFAPTVVLGFPQTFASLARDGVASNEFPSVRRWISMGDAAHRSHIERVLAGAPDSRFIDAFGSSELGMALFRKESTITAIAPSRCVGRPVDVAVAKVLDPETREEVAGDAVGLIAVRSPTITPGYWRSPEATAQAFANGYFLTGDVGFRRHGDFHLIDRAVDVIRSASTPIYTLLLEEELQQIPGVCDASVVGSEANGAGGSILALLLLDHDQASCDLAVASAAWSALRARLGSEADAFAPDRILVAVAEDQRSFPLGATGKVLKARLREMLPSLCDALAQGRLPSDALRCATNGLSMVSVSTQLREARISA